MSSLKLYLLGPPRVELEGGPVEIKRRKGLALLTYLAVTGVPQRRDTFATILWPNSSQSSARTALRRDLSALNKALDKSWLAIDRETVGLRHDSKFWFDVNEFQQRLATTQKHSHPPDEVCPACLDPLSEAVSLYRDDFLTGFTLSDCPDFDEWQFFQTESLRQELASALERLVQLHTAQSEFEQAIPHTRRWLVLDPLHEPAQRQLMQLYAWTEQQAAALRQYEECVRVLDKELGVPPEEKTMALYGAIKAKQLPPPPSQVADTPSPLSASTSSPPHNLPSQLTPFIGRVEELAEINHLLKDEPDCRMLTLVGPGGMGKTRLSLQAAVDSIEAFPNGVYFVSLAPISTAESLVPTITDALNLSFSGGDPKDQLLNYLRERTMLLVLDNFEHLLSPSVEGDGSGSPPNDAMKNGTDLLSDMIMAAPQVKLLVTSRERLHLQEEWAIEVQGMRFPPPPQPSPSEKIEEYSAVQLFLQRARRARPGFTLSDEESPDVVRLCQLVAGMPLGLELAAAWVRMMSCREIVREIERSLDFLTTSLRNVPERQQSLRGVFNHSWQLLPAEERAVFRKLSVFRGGFRRRAAERVAGASLLSLSALVDKSLLRRTRTGRYEIHELLRQYAAEKLHEVPGESEQAQDRHADYYLTFLQQRTDALKGARQEEALAEIAADIDNMRIGWQRATAQRNITALGKSADGLLRVSDDMDWLQEGAAAFRQAVNSLREEQEEAWEQGNERENDSAEAQPLGQIDKSKVANRKSKIVLAQLLRGEGFLSSRLGLLGPGQELVRQSVSLLRQAERGSQRELAFSLFLLALTYWLQGQYNEVKRYAQESLTLYTETGDRWGIGRALWILGMLATYQGEYAQAKQFLQKSRGLLDQIGNRRHMMVSIMFLGTLARVRGEYMQAEEFLEECLQTAHDHSNLRGSAYILRELGYLAIALGNYPQAKEQMQESLALLKDMGDRTALVLPLDGLASVTRLLGDYQQAEQLHQESLAMCREIGEGRGIALGLHNLGRLAYDRGDYATAEQHQQESLVRYKEIGHLHGQASALCHLGYAACASGSSRHQEAGKYFNQALEIAAKIDAPPLILDILVGLATLWAADEPENAKQEQAVELLALALHHPASEQETKDKANRLLAELASELPSELMTTAQERGIARKPDTVIAEIMSEMIPSGDS